MIRERDKIYTKNNGCVERPKKVYDDEYATQVKKEMRLLHQKIDIYESRLRYAGGKSEETLKVMREDLEDLLDDMEFWKAEMNKFDNLPRHKRFKPTLKKMKKEKLKEAIMKIIKNTRSSDWYYVNVEDIARQLQVKEKYVFQIFADLNKEGVLSQAIHGLPHDCYRPGDSGWRSDLYRILN